MSVAVLHVSQFATYSSLSDALDYIDRNAPPIKFQFLLRPHLGVLSRWRSHNTRWHLKIPSSRRPALHPMTANLVDSNSWLVFIRVCPDVRYGAAIAANFVSATDLNTTFSSVHSHSVIWPATLPTLQAATNGTIIELMIIYAAGRMSALGLRPASPEIEIADSGWRTSWAMEAVSACRV
jgi:hypothetical protein